MPEAITTALTTGFGQVNGMVSDVLVIAIPVVVGVVVLSGGADFAIKKLKGALKSAS